MKNKEYIGVKEEAPKWIEITESSLPSELLICEWKHPEYGIVEGNVVVYSPDRDNGFKESKWIYPSDGSADIALDEFTHYRKFPKKVKEEAKTGEREYILCAAIHYDDKIKHPHQPKNIETGVVICGRRHHNCYAILSGLLGEHENGEYKGKLKVVGRDAQGFITNLNRYVNRSEGWLIAQKAGQIVNGVKVCSGDDAILISENLY